MKINLPHISRFVRSFHEMWVIPKKVTKFCLAEDVVYFLPNNPFPKIVFLSA